MGNAALILILLSAVMATVSSSDLSDMINKEVALILNNEPNLTSEQCAQRCDDVFGMILDTDEDRTDRKCLNVCTRALQTTVAGQTHKPTRHGHHGHHDTTTPSF